MRKNENELSEELRNVEKLLDLVIKKKSCLNVKTGDRIAVSCDSNRKYDYYLGGVYTDNVVHTARSSSACFPLFQCTLSAA